MKRIISIIICFLFLFSSATAASSNLLETDSTNNSDDFAIYTAVSANGLIGVCDMNKYRYLFFDAERKIAEFSSLTFYDQTVGKERYRSPLTLVSDGEFLYSIELTVQNDPLYGIDFVGAGLYQYDVENTSFEFVCSLDLKEAFAQSDNAGEYCRTCLDAVAGSDYLCLLFEQESETTGLLTFDDESAVVGKLLCFGRTNEEKRIYTLPGVRELIAINGNWLLYAQMKSDSQDIDIQALNLADGTQVYFMTITAQNGQRANCFSWNGANNSLLYVFGNQVFQVKSTEENSEAVASLAIRNPAGLLPLGENSVAAWTEEALVTTTLDGQSIQDEKLVILGNNKYLDSFALENNDVQLAKYDGALSIVDILQTHSQVPDIMILNTYNKTGVQQLLDRGYALPIESQIISEIVNRMHPDIQEQVVRDGQIIALPYALLTQSMVGAFEKTWEYVDGQMPTTWTEMLLFLKNWSKIKQQHPDIGLFAEEMDATQLKYWLLDSIIRDYEQYRTQATENIGYDTETFKSLLTTFQALNFDQILQERTGSESMFLFSASYEPSAEENMFGTIGLPLSINDEYPSYMTASMYIMVINPYSKHPDVAIRLLEYVAKSITPIDKIEMIPTENAPLREDDYEKRETALAAEIKQIKDKMQSAETVDLIELEMEKEAKENALKKLNEDSWLASTESIQQYRSESKHIGILFRTLLSSQEQNNMNDEMERFLQGQMSLEQYVNTLQRRYVMSSDEGA